MKTPPLISIIVPFLNRRSFLAEAIESVLAQTYTNWELFLVDDGSTDASTDIARDYAQRSPDRIRYLEHPGHVNRGASASRNLGRRHASGAWIAYLDSDDLWFPTKLEEQLAIVDAHPEVGLIVGATEYWHSWSGKAEDQGRDAVIRVGGPQDLVTQPPRLLELLYPLGRGSAPSVNTFLVRADLIDRTGGWEESFRIAYTDQAFLVKIYLGAPVYISSACWDRYRHHPDSTMSTALTGDGYHVHRRHFLEWFESYLAERGMKDSAAWALLQAALAPYQETKASRRRPLRDALRRLLRLPKSR